MSLGGDGSLLAVNDHTEEVDVVNAKVFGHSSTELNERGNIAIVAAAVSPGPVANRVLATLERDSDSMS